MPRQTVERVFSRKAFLFFLFIAPAAILTLITIILATQYKELQSVVSAHAEVKPFEWKPTDQAHLDTVLTSLQDFSTGTGSDTLRLSVSELSLLAAASPTLQKQNILLRVTGNESLLVVETTQSIEDQHRALSWIFKKVIPQEYQYLNARLEGLPQWKEQHLELVPEKGSLNGAEVPRAALLKRPGMSPRDFIEDSSAPAYQAFLSVLDSTYYAEGAVVLLRRSASEPIAPKRAGP